MEVRFWGTRGSIAAPGPSTIRYGGNTSCVELRSSSGTLVVIDCGTGAHRLSHALMQGGPRPLRGHILISHTHWDHIQGLPFFAPLFVPGNEWDIYAPHGFEQSVQETLAGQMQYTYFPVALHDLPATIRYHEMVEGTLEVGDIRVTTRYLNHPALTLGFRLEADGVCVVYACDHEPHHREVADGVGELHGGDARHAEFVRDADLLIHDAQYVAAEYDAKKGWGHSTVEYAVEVSRAAGVRRLALTHHEPMRDDAALDAIVARLRARNDATGSTMDIFAAAEGQSIELTALSPHDSPEHVAGSHAPSPSALVDRTVLLGVADATLAATLLEAAQADGLRVVLETDADHVLGRAIDAVPSLVVLDTSMPSLDEREFVRALRGSGRYADGEPPVIVVGDREGEPIDGITEWIVTPFSKPYARARIRAALLRTACRWVPARKPADETRRLAALRNLGLLDTPAEERFDRLTRLAAAIFDVPTALVSLVDRDRQWFKSAHGADGVRESPRESSFCAHAVVERETLVVPDTLSDTRFADNPMVTGGPRVRFYAGEPLILPDGSCIGTVCLLDTRPREVDGMQLELLRDIGALVQRELLLTDAGTARAGS